MARVGPFFCRPPLVLQDFSLREEAAPSPHIGPGAPHRRARQPQPTSGAKQSTTGRETADDRGAHEAIAHLRAVHLQKTQQTSSIHKTIALKKIQYN
jgi:hypothetical protein